MDLRDATLMIVAESAAQPEVARLAQSAYDTLADGGEVPYPVLSDLIGEVSGKGVLRALHQKYSPTAYEALITPILREIDRQRPVPPRPRPAPEDDPLTSPTFRP